MTVINFAFIDAPTAAASGTVEVRPLRRTVGDTSVLVTAPITVTIAAGAGTVTLDGAATVYWQFREKLTGVPTGEQVWRTYQIPASGTVTFPSASIVLVDRYSLAPEVEPEAAWDAALAAEVEAREDADDTLTTAVDAVADDLADTDADVAALDLALADVGDDVAALTPTAWADLTGGLPKFTQTPLATPQQRLWAGEVYLAGRFTITGGSGMTSGELVFTLPVGRRPPLNRWIEGRKQDWGAVLLLCTAATGVVTAPTSGAATSIDLDGVRFRV